MSEENRILVTQIREERSEELTRTRQTLKTQGDPADGWQEWGPGAAGWEAAVVRGRVQGAGRPVTVAAAPPPALASY